MNTNENSTLNEGWQAQINFQIQPTTLEELKSYINDGMLQPTDKVRIKNLPWLEAQRVPAFQKLFESKRTGNAVQTTSASAPTMTTVEAKPETKVDTSLDSALVSDQPTTLTIATVKTESEVFKIYEQKTLAKNNQIDAKPKEFQSSLKTIKNSSIFLNIAGFLVGSVLMFLLALGGSYLWVFQLTAPLKIDEKSITELVILQEKLATDKVGLRLKVAANEQESTTENPKNPLQKTDIAQEFAKLDKQFDTQRKNIVQNYRNNLVNNDFNNTFYLSSAVLMILFLLIRIIYGNKTQPVENNYSPKLSNVQIQETSNIPTSVDQKVDVIDSENIHITKPADAHTTKSPDAHTTKSPDIHKTKSPNSIETIDEFLHSSEYLSYVEQEKVNNCLLHRDEPSKFVCEVCSNYFCEECPKTINEIESCCPFCQVACKSVDSTNNKKIEVELIASESHHVKSKIKTISNFTIYEYPDDKTRKISIFGSFLTALLLSTSISIFWVYKISPYLDKRDQEISQNISPNDQQNSEKNNEAKIVQANSNVQSNNENVAVNGSDEPCIDPHSKQPFECDEETRKAFYDHTQKTKSVANAEKQVKEKTNMILSLTLPSASPESENAVVDEKPNAIDEKRKSNDKHLFFKIFTGSFLAIFGLLLSTRFFGKE